MAISVVKFIDGISMLKCKVSFMKLLKFLMAISQAVPTKADPTRPYPLLPNKAGIVNISWASRLGLDIY